MKNILNGNTDT